MTKYPHRFFSVFRFTPVQVKGFLDSAKRDLRIARADEILEVKFSYAYTALIKGGLAWLAREQVKIKSVPGHHVKILEALAGALHDEDIAIAGNTMRAKRNADLYTGGMEVTEKECETYLAFVERVLSRLEDKMDK